MSTEQPAKNIGDYLYKAMLFLGIFAVASNGGDNSYTFDIGLYLLIAVLSSIVMMGIIKLMELRCHKTGK